MNHLTIHNDRYFFASYLNMARHNVFLIITSICQRLGKGAVNNDDDIFTNKIFGPLQDEKRPDEALRIIELLRRHFPFLEEYENRYLQFSYPDKPGKEKADAGDYYEMFRLLFTCLKELRNEFSHINQPETIVPTVLTESMKGIFDAAVRRTKDRMKYDEGEVSHLRRLKPQGFGQQKKMVEAPGFMYKFESSGKLTEKGYAFLICLFLEPQYSNKFLKQLAGFKDSTTRKAQATLEVFREYSIRMPRLRIDSSAQENLLFMDILNELVRCPNELYEQLGVKEKEKFKITVEEEADDENENPVNIILKRYEDRFPYFAMRTIDQLRLFASLRFMIDLGNYHFKVYEKDIAGVPRMRRLSQKLTTFGRIQDYSVAKMKEKYGDLVKNASEVGEEYPLPMIVETTPHYHYFEDNIALKIIEGQQAIYPDISTRLNPQSGAPSKSDLRPDLYISRDELMAMSACAILAHNHGWNKAETILLQHYGRIRKCFEAIQQGTLSPVADKMLPNLNSTYHNSGKDTAWEQEVMRRGQLLTTLLNQKFTSLQPGHLPDDLRHYLLGIEYNNADTVAEKKITKMIEKNESLLRRIKKDTDHKERRNKVGSPGHREVKAGKLGDFIARDLLRFQPEIVSEQESKRGKGKATGLTFQVLQASIAFFGLKKDSLNELFRACNLIESDNAHPFLSSIKYEQCRGIVDFYIQYLEKRKYYLEKCLKERQFSQYFWLRNNKSRAKEAQDYARQLASRYLRLPVNIPRGLFTTALKELMLSLGNDALTQAIERAPRTNTIFLLQQYFELHLNDAPQPAYFMKRTYKIINQFNARNNRPFDPVKEILSDTQELTAYKQKIEKWIPSLPEAGQGGLHPRAAKRAALNDLEKSEKKIRHQKAQDMTLFLMVKALLESSGDTSVWQNNLQHMKLKDLYPNAEKGILSTPVPFTMSITCTEEKDHKPVPNGQQIVKYIHQDALKLKNYGDFRRFVKDRRLNNLMFYLSSDTLSKETIVRELENYDKIRIRIYQLILEFEQALLCHWPEAAGYNGDGKETSRHGLLLDFLFEQVPTYKPLKAPMKNLRNTLSHNQFPEFCYFGKYNNGTVFVSDIFVNFAEKSYGKIAETIRSFQ